MGLFGTIKSGLGASPSLLMIIVLGVADQLWGDNLFNCPCGDRATRVLFTLPFLCVPPVIIIAVDTPWRFVRTTCRCDMSLTWCKWIYRPVIIAVIWLLFSMLQPKFGDCMFTEESCACSEAEKAKGCDDDVTAGKEKAAFTRVVAAYVALGIGALLLLIGFWFLLWMCSKNQCAPCCNVLCRPCRKCNNSIRKLPLIGTVFPEEGKLRVQRALQQTVLAMGLKRKTIIKLQEKGLFQSSRQLAEMAEDPQQLEKLKSLSAGQIDILRRFPKERILVQTLIVVGLQPTTVIKLREQGVADERLADKLSDDDYQHMASVITKEQLKILKRLPSKWALVQMLLRAGLEAATLVKLEEEELLDEDELLNLSDSQLTDIQYAVSLDQRHMLSNYATRLYLIQALVAIGLKPASLTVLRKHRTFEDEKLQITDEEFEVLERDLSSSQFELLKKHASKLPAYWWLCKEMGPHFDRILAYQSKGNEQIIEVIAEINALRLASETVPRDVKKKLQQFLTRASSAGFPSALPGTERASSASTAAAGDKEGDSGGVGDLGDIQMQELPLAPGRDKGGKPAPPEETAQLLRVDDKD